MCSSCGLLPYFYDAETTIARSVQNFFISNKTPRRKLLNLLLNSADRTQLPKIIVTLGRVHTNEVSEILLKKFNEVDDELDMTRRLLLLSPSDPMNATDPDGASCAADRLQKIFKKLPARRASVGP